MIPYGKQQIRQSDIDAVIEVLRSDFLTQGPVVPAFETAVAERVQAAHAVAANSATSALHLAYRALGIGPGDIVWTSPITFVATANAARYCGAEVDFVDIDPDTYNLSVDALAERLARAEREGRLPRLVVPVHLCGQSCDMVAIQDLGRRYGFAIVEDAAHAIGADYRGRPVGCGEYSDITVFSFHPVKIITSGEGGLAVTNDVDLAARMSRLRSHGITRDAADLEAPGEGGWYYEQQALGFNYRLSDLQAALGLSQLARLDSLVEQRRRLAARYDRKLADLPLRRPHQADYATSCYHLYPVWLDPDAGPGRGAVYAAMRDAGIGVNVHYIPVHLQPYYRRLGFAPGAFPHAERYYRGALTLPLYPDLSEAEQDRVVACLGRSLREEG